MLTSLLWIYRVAMALVVGALVYDYYAPTGFASIQGTESLYTLVALVVLLEPAFWVATHLFGGVMMGIAAGGFLDGVRLSLILGVGLGLARLWFVVVGAAAGVYAGGGPLIYSIGGVVLAVVLFGLERAMLWMWHYSKHDA